MEQELVGVGDVLDIEELDAGVVLGIKVLVHILEHVLDADLLAVADTPYGVELQTLLDGRLQDEDGRGAEPLIKSAPLGLSTGTGLVKTPW